jgi:hypothetical protein
VHTTSSSWILHVSYWWYIWGVYEVKMVSHRVTIGQIGCHCDALPIGDIFI